MKILEIRSLAIPDVKIVRYARFGDERGYFTETYRKSDFFGHANSKCFEGIEFKQCNESRSRKSVIRGLHFQWNPYQGKLVRTVAGHIIDLALDIRLGSPTFGRIVAYDLPACAGRGLRRLDLAAARLRPRGLHVGEFDDRIFLFVRVVAGQRDGHFSAGAGPGLVAVRSVADGGVPSHAGNGAAFGEGPGGVFA